jgi:hypothetical protein
MRKRVVTIHIHAEDTEQLIRASVHGLDRENLNDVLDRIHVEAMNLLCERMWRRRFRAPFAVHFLPERTGAHTLVGLIEAKDARGRKAAVRIKVSGLAGGDGKRTGSKPLEGASQAEISSTPFPAKS